MKKSYVSTDIFFTLFKSFDVIENSPNITITIIFYLFPSPVSDKHKRHMKKCCCMINSYKLDKLETEDFLNRNSYLSTRVVRDKVSLDSFAVFAAAGIIMKWLAIIICPFRS